MCQNEVYASSLWVIPVTRYRAERSSARMQKWPATGRPLSFKDSTALHLSAVYSWRLTGRKLAWRCGMYALLYQDNSCRVGCYWSIPSVQGNTWQLLHHSWNQPNPNSDLMTKVLRPVYSDTTQLNSTELNSTAWTTVNSVCRSWRHKQKHDWLGCTLFNWVSWVQLNCVAINTP